MQLEIIRGPDAYCLENYAPKPAAPATKSVEPVPEVRRGFSELYSNKHEKLLLRVEHVERMDEIRKAFNKARLHPAEPPMTTSDLVNASLDFVFQHRIAFAALKSADDLPKFLAEQVYRDVLSRWRQWTESF